MAGRRARLPSRGRTESEFWRNPPSLWSLSRSVRTQRRGLAQIALAKQLDPFFPGLHLFAGRILFFLRDYDGAIAYFTTTLELQPTNAVAHEHFGDACERKGMRHEAITQWCASLTLGGQPEQAQFLEQAFAASGFDAAVRALAQRQLQHLNERSARGEYVPAWNYLTAYLRLGDKEQALVWLAKTVEERNWFAFETRVTPILDPLPTISALTKSLPFFRRSNTECRVLFSSPDRNHWRGQPEHQ